jgi:hypothetical protein
VSIADNSTLKFKTNTKFKQPDSLYGSPVFWIGIGSPLVLALLLGFTIRRKEHLQPQLLLRKQKEELKKDVLALLHAAELNAQNGDRTAYYANLEKAVEKSISWYVYKEMRVLSKNEILNQLKERSISAERVQSINTILEQCEHARFGMDNSLNKGLIPEVRILCTYFMDK